MARRPSSAPSKVGLGSRQRELVVDRAGNLYRLPGKFSGEKSRFKSCLHCGFAQDWWTTRCDCRNQFACFIEHHVNRDCSLRSHPFRTVRINWRRQMKGSAVKNSTRHGLENRAWARSWWRFVDHDQRNFCVRADWRNSDINWTRGELRR